MNILWHLAGDGTHTGTHHNSNYFLDVFPQGPWEVKTGLLDHTLTLEGTFASFTVPPWMLNRVMNMLLVFRSHLMDCIHAWKLVGCFRVKQWKLLSCSWWLSFSQLRFFTWNLGHPETHLCSLCNRSVVEFPEVRAGLKENLNLIFTQIFLFCSSLKKFVFRIYSNSSILLLWHKWAAVSAIVIRPYIPCLTALSLQYVESKTSQSPGLQLELSVATIT